jgi:hypothetical protein
VFESFDGFFYESILLILLMIHFVINDIGELSKKCLITIVTIFLYLAFFKLIIASDNRITYFFFIST